MEFPTTPFTPKRPRGLVWKVIGCCLLLLYGVINLVLGALASPGPITDRLGPSTDRLVHRMGLIGGAGSAVCALIFLAVVLTWRQRQVMSLIEQVAAAKYPLTKAEVEAAAASVDTYTYTTDGLPGVRVQYREPTYERQGKNTYLIARGPQAVVYGDMSAAREFLAGQAAG
jgi:hypothetical protein